MLVAHLLRTRAHSSRTCSLSLTCGWPPCPCDATTWCDLVVAPRYWWMNPDFWNAIETGSWFRLAETRVFREKFLCSTRPDAQKQDLSVKTHAFVMPWVFLRVSVLAKNPSPSAHTQHAYQEEGGLTGKFLNSKRPHFLSMFLFLFTCHFQANVYQK